MRFVRALTAVTLTAPLLLAMPAVHAAPAPASPLTTPSCISSLQAVGEHSGLASNSELALALTNCTDTAGLVPRAQFAVISLTGSPHAVGAVFAQTNPSTLWLYNQMETTMLFMNGTTEFGENTVLEVKDAPMSIAMNGTTYSAKATTMIGDGGQFIKVRLDSPVGTVSPVLTRETMTLHGNGTPVLAFNTTGPVTTTIGPTYKKKWQSLNAKVYGTVTLANGMLIGRAGDFGTGYDDASWKFWKNRSYYMPIKQKG